LGAPGLDFQTWETTNLDRQAGRKSSIQLPHQLRIRQKIDPAACQKDRSGRLKEVPIAGANHIRLSAQCSSQNEDVIPVANGRMSKRIERNDLRRIPQPAGEVIDRLSFSP
jgi:hypothetical protein